MERIGEITAVKGNWLEVTFCRPTDCGHCHACMGTKKQTTVRVKGKGNVGDAASVEIPSSTVLQASMLAYGVPLVTLMAGMFLGSALSPANQDLGGGIGAIAGLLVGLGILMVTEKGRANNPKWTPVLKQVLPAIKKNPGDAPEEAKEEA